MFDLVGDEMTVQQIIEDKLTRVLVPDHLEVINESSNHNVPQGSESHFKVTLVAKSFENQRLLERHRIVNKILADELSRVVHALALHTYTETEWRNRNGDAPMSPPCSKG